MPTGRAANPANCQSVDTWLWCKGLWPQGSQSRKVSLSECSMQFFSRIDVAPFSRSRMNVIFLQQTLHYPKPLCKRRIWGSCNARSIIGMEAKMRFFATNILINRHRHRDRMAAIHLDSLQQLLYLVLSCMRAFKTAGGRKNTNSVLQFKQI
jgi:hypothetical protein